jgi:flagellar hook assembly protein FlgD
VTELLAPYPNPVRRGATIGFRLARAGGVELELFDLAGHRIRRIESRAYPAGDHAIAWDGADGLGRKVPAGLYVVRLKTNDVEARRKLLVAP